MSSIYTIFLFYWLNNYSKDFPKVNEDWPKVLNIEVLRELWAIISLSFLWFEMALINLE